MCSSDLGPNGLTLVGIGPATNLGLALATEPALAANIAEIVLMTGAWAEGNVTPAADAAELLALFAIADSLLVIADGLDRAAAALAADPPPAVRESA